MKPWSCLTVALVLGCTSQDPLPPGPSGGQPGGGTPGSGSPVDASVALDGQSSLVGRLCALDDLRQTEDCPISAALGDITVADARGSAQAVSFFDGRFAIDASALNTSQGRVLLSANAEAAGYVSSLAVIDSDLALGGPEVPLISRFLWDDILAGLGIALPDDSGALVVSLRADDLIIVGGEVIASAAYGIYYDGADTRDWIFGALTGSRGVALVLGVTPPAAELVAIDELGNSITIPDVPVVAGAMTFLTVDFVQ